MKGCPTKCLTEENFVIDVGKCITLYNELPDPLLKWINPKAHNALMGCLSCQYDCPENKAYLNNTDTLEDITEEETKMLLTGGTDKKLQESVKSKLKRIGGSSDLAYIGRNLKVLLGL